MRPATRKPRRARERTATRRPTREDSGRAAARTPRAPRACVGRRGRARRARATEDRRRARRAHGTGHHYVSSDAESFRRRCRLLSRTSARTGSRRSRARTSIDVACGSSTLWLAACPRPPRRTRPPRVAARAGNAATDANADAQNDIVAVEFAPDGGRERAWTAVHRVDLRPKRARGGFVSRFGAKAIARFVKRAFLPAGFPGTVSPDYLAFQSWDTAQGLCSYVRGRANDARALGGRRRRRRRRRRGVGGVGDGAVRAPRRRRLAGRRALRRRAGLEPTRTPSSGVCSRTARTTSAWRWSCWRRRSARATGEARSSRRRARGAWPARCAASPPARPAPR